MGFIHLHTHSCFSLLDGLSTPKEIVEKTKSLGMTSVALTDHGNLYAAFKFKKICETENVKPLIGEEFYFVPDRKIRARGFRHVVLIAKNQVGWFNLAKLSTISNSTGFYYRPRIDIELIRQYHDGIIALSACQKGVIASYVLNNEFENASKAINNWLSIFGSDFYLEIMPIESQEQSAVNKFLVEMSKSKNVKLVATADSHYMNREDADVHSIMLRIRDVKIDLGNKELWFKSEQEMIEAFRKFHPELPMSSVESAVANTQEVADKIEVFGIARTYEMPQVPIQTG